MELAGKNGDKFELTIIRYQFPHSSTDEWDANWLIVRTHATIADHEWASDDPLLLTWEVEELASWWESLGNNREVKPLLDFVEPNLCFELLDCSIQTARLQVFLQLEAPLEIMGRAGRESRGPVLDCSSNDLLAWSKNLREELSKFPKRAPLPKVSRTVLPTTNDPGPTTSS